MGSLEPVVIVTFAWVISDSQRDITAEQAARSGVAV